MSTRANNSTSAEIGNDVTSSPATDSPASSSSGAPVCTSVTIESTPTIAIICSGLIVSRSTVPQSSASTGTTYVVIPANSGPFLRTIQMNTIVETPLPIIPNSSRYTTASGVTIFPVGAVTCSDAMAPGENCNGTSATPATTSITVVSGAAGTCGSRHLMNVLFTADESGMVSVSISS